MVVRVIVLSPIETCLFPARAQWSCCLKEEKDCVCTEVLKAKGHHTGDRVRLARRTAFHAALEVLREVCIARAFIWSRGSLARCVSCDVRDFTVCVCGLGVSACECMCMRVRRYACASVICMCGGCRYDIDALSQTLLLMFRVFGTRACNNL